MEQIKQLKNNKERLALELEHTNHQLDTEKRRLAPSSMSATSSPTTFANLQPHEGQQIKFIQATMEQLLQLDLFVHTESTTGTMKERKR